MSTDDEVEAVLAQRLGALGTRVAPVSGAGARWSAQRLRTETAAERAPVRPGAGDRVMTHLADLLGAPVEVGDDGGLRVRGKIGSGFGGLNPAYVVAVLEPTGHLAVAAHAKEGLIRQRTAAKAVRRVLDEARGVG